MRDRLVLVALLALGFTCGSSNEARAAENAAGWYALGTKASMAGFVPPPGTYFVDVNLYYEGTASAASAVGVALQDISPAARKLNLQGELLVEAKADVTGKVYYNLPSILWVAPQKVLGGNVGFGAIVPFGWKDVNLDLDALATLSLGPPINKTFTRGQTFSLNDSSTEFGDPVLNALIGWHEGNWHWNVSALLNVPIGPWDNSSSSNLSFNHWGLDTTAAVTWLDPKTGFEVSAAPGFTFNWENPDTDYTTGTEFHVEFAILEHFSQKFAVGIAGYHYQQVTGDSGPGARLGNFKGRVTSLGPVMTYNFNLGKIPVSTQLLWTHDFDVENRLKGDLGLLTISFPLSGSSPAPASLD
jgi:hypothetical protein